MVSIQRQGILFCILGPAGSGKSTLSAMLLKEFEGTIAPSISYTTRSPRASELPGMHYHFVSRDAFMAKVKKEEFFEWEETHGNLYGTPHAPLTNSIKAGVDLVLDIDIRGAENFKKTFGENVVSIFLLPPSIEDLKKRIHQRGCSTTEELATRLKTAQTEFSMFLDGAQPKSPRTQVDYSVVNDRIDECYQTIRSIVLAERQRTNRLDHGFLVELCTANEAS